ncbi:PhzF family phenazine biosynthesis protein [Corynebacterium frankenforstense]|uniref:PhzF family phenazine biosynthesis protein n=1 Tax=Corynebacterium frankenforstense TaxID=1230998 RepID=UPI000AF7F844|nr:PhzF family phenazine biosynthesis protein [Corynebacterium frankenforstense]
MTDGPLDRRLDYLELDVFATGAFTGNPVGVVAGADRLSDAGMARIAAWTNFSETTFLLEPREPGADYRVRIFTPTEEFPFAGHPTLGTAAAWLELGGRPARPGTVVQECGAGLVEVRVTGDELAFATPPLQRTGPLDDAELARVTAAFGLAPDEIVAHAWGDNGPGWRLIQLAEPARLDSLRHPGPGGPKVGFCVLTGDDAPFYRVRAFTPNFEDPVTGSLNGALGQWLRARGLAPERFTAAQGAHVGRAGEVLLSDDGTDVWVGGRVRTRVRGTLRV